ncbi:MAG TPA: holo-ACP synthase [Acidiferrobacteraceae bacterium]|nr:holo-ACP synthase [Acidiferrobacteraceae bacterium]
MIFGIGTDLVCVDRIQANLDRFGDRFAHRILSEEEFSEYQADKRKPWFLAKRFAAKEAAVKAMGIGFSDGIGMQQISVVNNKKGQPQLRFEGKALAFIRAQAVVASHLSISDERDHAIAFVTLEKS